MVDHLTLGLGEARPLVLIILDGWGIQRKKYGNAIANANLPEMQRLWKECPHTTLNASGLDVGLPEGVMGNSEVGHTNLGAGRVVLQDLVKINQAIAKNEFPQNKILNRYLTEAKNSNSNVHFMGLLSDAGVHSNINHLFALLELSKKVGCEKIWIHPFLDGRDTPPKDAAKYIQMLEKKLEQLKVGKIGTVMGRYYAMDRDKRWDRTAKAYYAIALAEGLKAASAEETLKQAYERGETDEFVLPTVIESKEKKYLGFHEADCAVFFNFRPDRPRQLVRSFFAKDFAHFDRKQFFGIKVVCMTEYDSTFMLPVAFPPEHSECYLGKIISEAGLNQLRIAETEKYAHVTFFFNGGREQPCWGEDRILVPSPKVATYDLKPEMSAYEVTQKLTNAIKSGKYDFICANYANPDMVAHSGVLDATVKALEVVDRSLSGVIAAVKSVNGLCIVTSDHGHAEQLIDYDTGGPWTAHTLNRVPLIIVTDKKIKLHPGRLANVAPTILKLMQIQQPKEMTAKPLF